ncbi:MAG: Xaa-Pro peptidase family protein, partial [Acidimicrobiia bacterium]
FDHAGRVGRLRQMMSESEIDVVMLSAGSDLPYFTGYEATASERLTMLVVKQKGDPMLLVPQLEAPRVGPGPFEMVAWSDTDDPIGVVARAVGHPIRVAVGDHTWSAFLVALQSQLTGVEWGIASELTKKLRVKKDPEEIATLRTAAEGVDRVLSRARSEVRFAGRSERQVARDFALLTVEEGHEVVSFTIIGSGPNSASPHHEPGLRLIREGDLVVCDFGGRVSGYCSDVTRTFSVGEPGGEEVEIHGLVEEANRVSRSVVGPGVPCQEVDRWARTVIAGAGYGRYFIHRTGHGIGLEVHEHPYMVEGNDLLLEPGMAFSVEPGIYLPGRFGVRIEDIVVCTSDGVDVLNQADRGLVVVA